MTLRDLLFGPIVLSIIVLISILIRNGIKNPDARKYFFPALALKIIGAIAVGLIYQFYYGGGDTFAYFTYGAQHVVNGFLDSFSIGWKLLTSHGEYDPETYKYASKIWMYRDPNSFNVIRIASIFSLLSFNTYTGTAIWFAFFSFLGLWKMYESFLKIYPELHFGFALAIFFIPTVFFWGSGILKDTVTLAASGFLVHSFMQVFFERKNLIGNLVLLFASVVIIYSVKLYILLCLLPCLILWFSFYRIGRIQSTPLKILIAPFLLTLGLFLGYYVALKAGENNSRYALDKIAETAQVTAYDIRYWTGKDAGSGYTLGKLDGTFLSMIKLAPAAINVSIFRPYIWEVRNPFMLLSAIEAIFLLALFIRLFIRNSFKSILKSINTPIILFCLLFSIVFAFGVGVSTYNFGTLSRYRIVLVPFFVMAIYLLDFHASNRKK